MRPLFGILTFIILLNFSGIPDVLYSLTDTMYMDVCDESDSTEKEGAKEKEEKEKEKEDVKEPLLGEYFSLCSMYPGINLETHNGVIKESGFEPEDHSPPPDFI